MHYLGIFLYHVEIMTNKQLENTLEELCQLGCKKINILLQQLDQNTTPRELEGYSKDECDYLYNELRSIMAVYGEKGCEI